MSALSTGVRLTVLLPAGRLPLALLKAVHALAEEYGFEIYCSLTQNIRLINVPQSALEQVKQELAALGADFKAPGKFPLPRICIGKPHCNLGQIDTEHLSRQVLARFQNRTITKARFKISIAGCPVGCSWTRNTDLSIMATRAGYTVFAGGKGGLVPRTARRIKTWASEVEVLDILEILVDFHDKKTKTKQRMYQLLADPEFPFPEV